MYKGRVTTQNGAVHFRGPRQLLHEIDHLEVAQ